MAEKDMTVLLTITYCSAHTDVAVTLQAYILKIAISNLGLKKTKQSKSWTV
jgi:hypothetical protein